MGLNNGKGIGDWIAKHEPGICNIVKTEFMRNGLESAIDSFMHNTNLILDDAVRSVVNRYMEYSAQWTATILKSNAHGGDFVKGPPKGPPGEGGFEKPKKSFYYGYNTSNKREKAKIIVVYRESSKGKPYTQTQLRSNKTGRILRQSESFKKELRRRSNKKEK